MNRSFVAAGDRIRAELMPFEVDLLRSVHDGLVATLAEGNPNDPVIERLFPVAVANDAEMDAEVRRLLRDDLLGARRAGLAALTTILDRGTTHRGRLRVVLEEDEPLLLLGVLNDLRLAIGASVGIEDLDRDDLDPEDPVAYRLAVIDHFAWLQEQLLSILDPDDGSGDAHPGAAVRTVR